MSAKEAYEYELNTGQLMLPPLAPNWKDERERRSKRASEPYGHHDYMEFAERYADYVCEFEKKK